MIRGRRAASTLAATTIAATHRQSCDCPVVSEPVTHLWGVDMDRARTDRTRAGQSAGTPASQPVGRVVTFSEAAKLLGVHPKTLGRWVARRELKIHHRDPLGRKFLDLDTIDPELVSRAHALSDGRWPEKSRAKIVEQHTLATTNAWLRQRVEAQEAQIRELQAVVARLVDGKASA